MLSTKWNFQIFFYLHLASQPHSKENTTNCDYPFKEEVKEEKDVSKEDNLRRPKSYVPQHVKDSSLLDSSDDDENDEEEVLYRDDTFVSHASTENESESDQNDNQQNSEGKKLNNLTG